MKRLIGLILALCLFIPTYIYADANIDISLEQPSLLKVKAGQKINYNLKIKLPKDIKENYQSFTISLMMDKNLKLDAANLKTQDPAYDISKSYLQTVQRDIVSVVVSDTGKLLSNEANVEVITFARQDQDKPDFKNSFVLTSVDKTGKETSGQREVKSSTKALDSGLKLNPFYYGDKVLTGKTKQGADIIVRINDKAIATGLADDKGNFSIPLKDIKLNASLDVEVNYLENGEFRSATVNLTVKAKGQGEDSNKVNKVEKGDKNSALESADMNKLNLYINYARNIDVSKSSKENAARLMAALAYGQYMQVKSDVKNEEIVKAVNEIDQAQKAVRFPIMKGISDDKFAPGAALTRAQAAVIISRIDLLKDAVGEFSSFKDVKQDAWYADAVGYMEKKSYISGYKDGSFKPDKKISRAEFATIIARYLQLDLDMQMGYRQEPLFADVGDVWYKAPISAMTSKGFMSGRGNNKFFPEKEITRAEAITVLIKVLDRKPNKDFIDAFSKNPFKDVENSQWYYYNILEGTGN